MPTMLPPTLTPSPKSDRVYDLTLRLLMLALFAVLLGCIMLLVIRWTSPQAPDSNLVPVSQTTPRTLSATQPAPVSAGPTEVLHAPGQVFRCTIGGRVTFTDRPCPSPER